MYELAINRDKQAQANWQAAFDAKQADSAAAKRANNMKAIATVLLKANDAPTANTLINGLGVGFEDPVEQGAFLNDYYNNKKLSEFGKQLDDYQSFANKLQLARAKQRQQELSERRKYDVEMAKIKQTEDDLSNIGKAWNAGNFYSEGGWNNLAKNIINGGTPQEREELFQNYLKWESKNQMPENKTWVVPVDGSMNEVSKSPLVQFHGRDTNNNVFNGKETLTESNISQAGNGDFKYSIDEGDYFNKARNELPVDKDSKPNLLDVSGKCNSPLPELDRALTPNPKPYRQNHFKGVNRDFAFNLSAAFLGNP